MHLWRRYGQQLMSSINPNRIDSEKSVILPSFISICGLLELLDI